MTQQVDHSYFRQKFIDGGQIDPFKKIRHEELLHPWQGYRQSHGINPFQTSPIFPYFHFHYGLIVFDSQSEAYLDDDGNFRVGDEDILLQTKDQRRRALSRHVMDFESPFISGEACISRTFGLLKRHLDENRPGIRVALINNKARFRAGFPMLNTAEEMKHYKVKDRSCRYSYTTEILYPYIIPADQIVRIWDWYEIRKCTRRDLQIRAEEEFEKHERQLLEKENAIHV